MLTADYVEFTPDEEPYGRGVENFGIASITANQLLMMYCAKCGEVVSIENISDVDVDVQKG